MSGEESSAVVCPACGLVNKPNAANCRICGTRFREAKRRSGPILLQRVMTGEVFEAEFGGVPKAVGADPEELQRRRAELQAFWADLQRRDRDLRRREAALVLPAPAPARPEAVPEAAEAERSIAARRGELETLERDLERRREEARRELEALEARQREAERRLAVAEEGIRMASLAAELPADAHPVLQELMAVAEIPAATPAAGRVPTFVEGLDEALGGGIPAGHVVIVAGAAGTMKSSILLHVLLQNAVRQGVSGLFVTVEQSASSLLSQARSLGFDLDEVVDQVRILDFATVRHQVSGEEWLRLLQRNVEAARRVLGCELLVLDSIEALEVRAGMADRRREVFRLFEWFRGLGLTTFVVAERPDVFLGNGVVLGRWDEDFLADGVLHLRQHLTERDAQRRLRCVKMRGARHETSYLALLVEPGRFVATRPMGA